MPYLEKIIIKKLFKAKIMISIILLILSFSSAASSISYIDSTDFDGESDQYSYIVSIPEPQIIAIDDFDLPIIPRCGFIMRAGEPMLPTKTIIVLLPPSKDLNSLYVRPIKREILPGEYNIVPAPEPNILGEDPKSTYTLFNRKVYAQSSPYPSTFYAEPTIGMIRGYRLLILTLYPIQYIPSKHRLIFYKKFEIKINLTIRSDKNLVGAKPLPFLNRWLAKKVINPELLDIYSPLQETDIKGYLIITRKLFSNIVDLLKNFKESQGFHVYVKYTEDIIYEYPGRDVPEKIRNCIIQYYQNYGITYVLLFGDADPGDILYSPNYALDKSWEVPTRYVYNPDNDENHDKYATNMSNDLTPTDYYYAGLDGTWDNDNDGLFGESANNSDSGKDEADWLPEVFVGRIPVRNVEDAYAVVNKIISFYQNLSTTPKNFLLLGAHLFDTWEQIYTDGAWVKEIIADFYPSEIRKIKLYENEGTLTVENVTKYINELNPLIINSASHGNTHGLYLYWSRTPFVNESTPSLLSNRGFIWYSVSCLSAAYDINTTSLAELMLTDVDGSAVAYIGSSRILWGYISHYLTLGLAGMQDWLFWLAFQYVGAAGAGPALYTANIWYYFTWYDHLMSREEHRKNIFAMMLLGDPAISPFTGWITQWVSGEFSRGDKINISGQNFASNSQLKVYFIHMSQNDEIKFWLFPIIKANISNTGAFNITFSIPNTIPGLEYYIAVVDEFGNIAHAGYIKVKWEPSVYLTPNRGYGQFVVKINGVDFNPDSIVFVLFDGIYIHNPLFYYFPFFETDPFGRFNCSFVVPVTVPGKHTIVVTDYINTTVYAYLYIIDVTPLDIKVNVGSVHFRGELVEFYILTSFKGKRVNANITTAVLYGPRGKLYENLTGSEKQISLGLYEISYKLPIDAPAGTYTLIIEASYVNETIESKGVSFGSFLLSPTLSGWNTTLVDIENNTVILKTDLGQVKMTLDSLFTLISRWNESLIDVNENMAVLITEIGEIKMSLDSLYHLISGLNATIVDIENNTAIVRTDLGEIRMTLNAILSIVNETRITIKDWTGVSSNIAGVPTLTLTTSNILEGSKVSLDKIELVISKPISDRGILIQIIRKDLLDALKTNINDIVILIDNSSAEFIIEEYDTYYVVKLTYTNSQHFITILFTGRLDQDGDGIPNWKEYLRGTDPLKKDSDKDIWPDRLDVWPLNPILPNILLIIVALLFIIIKFKNRIF